METVTKNELSVILDNSGIEKTKGELISKTLSEFFTKASGWNETIEALQIEDVSEVGKMKMAREGRLTLKNMRLEAKKLVENKRSEVKAKMSDYVLEDKLWLKGFQMVEATFKNLETKLEEKEKFAERKEFERLAELERERINILMPYNEFCEIEGMDLKSMSEEDFNSKLEKAKKLLELDKAEKERLEAERLAKEKAEAEEKERIRLENEKLRKEAEERERLAKIEAAKREKAEKERITKENKERIEREKLAAKERAENEAKLKKAAEEKAKLEAELKAKREVEEQKIKREAEENKKRLELERSKSLAPQKEKIELWINQFELPEINTDNFDENAKLKVLDIKQKFNDFKKWSVSQSKIIN